MQTLDAIKARRAVKHFDANYRFTDEQINELFSLAILSPTAFNIQNWRFVNVSEPKLRRQIRTAAWGQAPRLSHKKMLKTMIQSKPKLWKKDLVYGK